MTQTVALNRRKSGSAQPPEQPPKQKATPSDSAKPVAKRAMRGVFQRPANSGVWWIVYYADGVRHREKIGSWKAACDAYVKRKNDARVGIKLPDSVRPKKAVLFKELAADAMVYSAEHKKSHRGDLSNLNSLLPEFGNQKADEITQQGIAAYFATRTDLKPASINRYRSTMSLIFAEGIRNGKVKTNPARLVRLRKEDNRRLRYLTYEEEALIRRFIVARCPTHEPDFTVALETGMRLSEQHTLEWSDVHLDRRQIQLVETKNGSSRVVVLTDEAVDALKVLWSNRNPETPRVFLTRYGKPMNNPRAWFELVMADAAKENPALADVTWHTFRHTYISRLVMSGVDMAVVQELAGHKSISMTARYTHLSPNHKLNAVAKLSAYRQEQGSKIA